MGSVLCCHSSFILVMGTSFLFLLPERVLPSPVLVPWLNRLSRCKAGMSWRWWWWWRDLVMAKCTRSCGANRNPGNKKRHPGITARLKHGPVAATTRVPEQPESRPAPTHFSPASASHPSHLNRNAVSMTTHLGPGRPSPGLGKLAVFYWVGRGQEGERMRGLGCFPPP